MSRKFAVGLDKLDQRGGTLGSRLASRSSSLSRCPAARRWSRQARPAGPHLRGVLTCVALIELVEMSRNAAVVSTGSTGGAAPLASRARSSSLSRCPAALRWSRQARPAGPHLGRPDVVALIELVEMSRNACGGLDRLDQRGRALGSRLASRSSSLSRCPATLRWSRQARPAGPRFGIPACVALIELVEMSRNAAVVSTGSTGGGEGPAFAYGVSTGSTSGDARAAVGAARLVG